MKKAILAVLGMVLVLSGCSTLAGLADIAEKKAEKLQASDLWITGAGSGTAVIVRGQENFKGSVDVKKDCETKVDTSK